MGKQPQQSDQRGPKLNKQNSPPVSVSTSFCSNLMTALAGKAYSHFVGERTKGLLKLRVVCVRWLIRTVN